MSENSTATPFVPCPRCRAPLDAAGACSRRQDGCQGGAGEAWENLQRAVASPTIRVTVDGPSVSADVSLDQVCAYLTRKGWEKRSEATHDDEGRPLNGTVEIWQPIGADAEPFVFVWVGRRGGDGERIAHLVERVARHEKRHPAEVLREIAGGDVGEALDLDAIERELAEASDAGEPSHVDVPALVDEMRRLREERVNWQRATGCIDPETIAAALGRIGAALDRTPTEGIPDAIERLKRRAARTCDELHTSAELALLRLGERDRALDEARLWRALARAERAVRAVKARRDKDDYDPYPLLEARAAAERALRALGIDPDAPEGT